MIKSFADETTAALFRGVPVRSVAKDIAARAQRRLMMIEAAVRLEDLRVPPGNKLKALEYDRKGQHSIRINDQWRICFRWDNGNAHDVEFTDYH